MKKNIGHKEIISILKSEKLFLENNFGVISIGLFGFFAEGKQRHNSDIDILVELKEPRFDWYAGLQIYLEQKFDREIGLVRKRKNNKNRFIEKIDKKVIYA